MEVTMLQGLYGSMIKPERAVGYCKRHGCYLTVATLKKHGCLGKQCWNLDKKEDNEYWAQRQYQKQLKKQRRGLN